MRKHGHVRDACDRTQALAHAFSAWASLHSGTELGVAQIAKAHVQASLPDEIRFAGDAVDPEYVDGVLVGGPLAITRAALLRLR